MDEPGLEVAAARAVWIGLTRLLVTGGSLSRISSGAWRMNWSPITSLRLKYPAPVTFGAWTVCRQLFAWIPPRRYSRTWVTWGSGEWRPVACAAWRRKMGAVWEER